MNRDILELNKIMDGRNSLSFEYEQYDKIYSYTTENQKGYMKDIYGDVLSVSGSGDHYLNLSSLGVDNIDSFDINKFSLYYLKLKRAAVKALDKNEFYEFLGNNAMLYYDRVKKYLDIESLSFWNYYIGNYGINRGVQRSRLFIHSVLISRVKYNNIYLDNNNYNALRSKLLKEKNEEFIHSDIYMLPNRLHKKYDFIFLSNIINYQKDRDKFSYFLESLYNNYLNDKGSIYYGYFYDNVPKKWDGFIPGTITMDVDSAKGIPDNRDYVYILKKS